MAQQPHKFRSTARGFTLIEIIVGLVTISASFVILTVIIFPQAQRSAEPILQARASNLGKAFLDEILGRSFDENSDRTGGAFRCGEDGIDCTAPDDFGPDGGEVRETFNDVDDFHELNIPLENALGTDIAAQYANFQYAIDVCYSDAVGNCSSSITQFKRVQVTVTTPLGQDFVFSGIRGNY